MSLLAKPGEEEYWNRETERLISEEEEEVEENEESSG